MRDNDVETAIERHTDFRIGAGPGGNPGGFLEMNRRLRHTPVVNGVHPT